VKPDRTPDSISEDLNSLLEHLYPEHDRELLMDRVLDLVHEYKAPFPVDNELNGQDVILITYGDSLSESTEPSLETLRAFFHNHLADAISAIHLLPFYPSSSDDGFAVRDYLKVDPAVGTWKHIAQLQDEADLMFDAVIGHMSSTSDWFGSFLEGSEEFEDFFIVVDPEHEPLLSEVVRPRCLPLFHTFEKMGEGIKIWTTFSSDQVDLNYRNPSTLLGILKVLLEYSKRRARFLRLDAVAYLWKETGTTCIHLPQTHALVRLIRLVLDSTGWSPRLITESNVPHADNISYFGNGRNEAHLVYNFTLPPLLLHTLFRGDARVLTRWAGQLGSPGEDCAFLNFTASHDGIGVTPLEGLIPQVEIMALCDHVESLGGHVSTRSVSGKGDLPYELNINYFDALGDPGLSAEIVTDAHIDRFILSQSIMLVLKGVPAIYYHSILGSRGWLEGPDITGMPRSVNREKLRAGQVEDELADDRSLRHRIYQRYCSLLALRRAYAAFHPSSEQNIIDAGKDLFVLCRKSENTPTILCLHNVTEQHQVYTGMPTGSWNTLTGRPTYNGSDLELAPFDTIWLADEQR